MKKGLIALATGSFALGFAVFLVMGIITNIAAGVGVTVPEAGGFISAYAVGVCFGTLILVFGHRIEPKRLLMAFMLLCCAGNAMAALAPDAATLTVARLISGMPHGAFFGTATSPPRPWPRRAERTRPSPSWSSARRSRTRSASPSARCSPGS